MTIDLKAIRERVEWQRRYLADESIPITCRQYDDTQGERDAEQLLALVDSAREYIRANACHADSCRVNYGRCTCHVGEMLRDLGEAP